ncbi:MAG: glycosyltransferase family 2 protein [Bacteroidota bacterium]|nr:glycosyltransferase family 2 protein [Bacteroidota bacterium]
MQLSVLIRNLNEADDLRICLCALRKQKTNFDFEIIVVDNESDDHSVEVAKQFDCRIINLPRKEFTYGKALNIGIAACTGEFILIQSSHVYLLSDYFLQSIPFYFSSDKTIAALRFVSTSSAPTIKNAIQNGERIMSMESENGDIEKIWLHAPVNNCAAIRKSVWEKYTYNESVFYSEDKIWAFTVLKAGFKIKTNVPLFYQYHKLMNRDQMLRRRALEEVAFKLVTGKAYRYYPGSFFEKTKYLYRQLRATIFRVGALFKTQAMVKEIYQKEKDRFIF